MKTLVIYKSKTGFTKKYAEIVAKNIDCTMLEFKKATAATMSKYDTIVFGSRVYAGMIDGWKKAKELFQKSSAKKLVVFATGATPNVAEEIVAEIWKTNLSAEEMETIPHFYMQSGICYEKMGWADKTIMKIASMIMSKKKEKGDYENGFEQAVASSFDASSEEFAQPLIDYLRV